MFKLKKETKNGRSGILQTYHGNIQTPFFLPVATAGAMKGVTLEDLNELGAEILLANTYHLHLSPGEKIIGKAGGLKKLRGGEKPILTDSGGFQVFSLKKIRRMTDDGVEFKDHRSGALHFLGPVEAMRIQHALGADIIMCFDECPPSTAAYPDQLKAVDRTLAWAKTCKKEHETLLKRDRRDRSNKRDTLGTSVPSVPSPLLFGIIQGGLAVGETEKEMFEVLKLVCPILPKDKLRYLMGIGDLKQIEKAVKLGIDMFDCVSPMREARHGNIWLSNGEKLRIRRSEFISDHTPIDPKSPSRLGRKHFRSYLHHLIRIGERYGETIACMQNLGVTLELFRSIQKRIKK